MLFSEQTKQLIHISLPRFALFSLYPCSGHSMFSQIYFIHILQNEYHKLLYLEMRGSFSICFSVRYANENKDLLPDGLPAFV